MKKLFSKDNKAGYDSLGARAMMIASVAAWGTIGLFVKNIPLSSGEIAMWRAVLAVFLLSVFLLLTKRKIEFGKIKKEIVLLAVSGIAIGIKPNISRATHISQRIDGKVLGDRFPIVIIVRDNE